MQDIAEAIVKMARTLPVDTGVALKCNSAVITKVAVTGGFGFEVTSAGKTSSLLFPMAAVNAAVVSFLTTGHVHPDDGSTYHPVVFHANGLPLLTFEWNDKKARESAQRYVSQLLLQPPLCHDMQTAAQASLSVDARDLSGWDIGSVQPMNEPMNEDAQERSDSEEEDEL